MATSPSPRDNRTGTDGHSLLHWLLLLSLTVMWGSAFMLTKIALASLSPTAVVAGRLVVASLLLLALWSVTRRRLPGGLRVWWYFLLIALFGNALPFSLISWGQAFIDSGLAGILMAVVPLFTLTLSHYFIPGERLTRRRVAGFSAGFFGIVVLMGPDALTAMRHIDSQLLPMLAVLAGAACYAIAAILARLRPAGDAVSSAAATTLIGALLMLPVLLQDVDGSAIHLARGIDIAAVVVLGIFSTAVATIIYFRLIGSAGPAFVSQLNYLIPLWAVLVGVAFLGEQVQAEQLYALLLILGGIAISNGGGARGPRTLDMTRKAPQATNGRLVTSAVPAPHRGANLPSRAAPSIEH